MNEKEIEKRRVDGYNVTLFEYGRFRIDFPNGDYTWEKLADDIDWDDTERCFEEIELFMHLHPEVVEKTKKTEMSWKEGQVEIQDENGNVQKVIIINDGTVQYWAVLDRTVDEAIADFCRTYSYSDEHEGESLEIGVDVIGTISGDVLSYKLGSHVYPRLKE